MAFGIILKKKLLGDLLPVPDPMTVDPNAVVDPAQDPANNIAFTPTISQLMTPIKVGATTPVAAQTVDPSQAGQDWSSVLDKLPKTGLQTSAAMIQPINTPAPQPWKPSALSIIDRVLGGQTITEANKAAQNDHDAELLKPQMDAMRQAQMAFAKTLDPMQQAAYLLNPTEWSKNVATRYGARTVNGGDSAIFGQPGTAGATAYTAPKLGESGGKLYTQTPTASAITGEIPQGYKPDWKQVENTDANGVKTTSWVDVNDPRNQTTGGPATSAPTPEPTGGVYDQIGQIATSSGAKPEEVGYLKRLAKIESNGNPSAQNGSSTSLFQFHPDTFTSLGGTNINDVGDQTKAAIALQRRDRQTLQSLGVAPTDANAYIMHQQGAGGGKALLTAPPNVGAVAALTPVYGSAAIATQAIAGNIGMPYKTPEQKAAANAKAQQMTVGDFTGMWRQKWGGDASAPAGGAPGGRMVAGGVQQPGADEATPLSEAAIDMAAMRYMQTGVPPPLGMGKAAREDRVKIQNRAAELIDKYNIKPEDWSTGIAQFKVTQGSLQQISKTKAMVLASEGAVEKNMDLVLSLAPKAQPGGVPFINKYQMALKDKALGDPDVKAYDSALHTVADEYAKVLTTTSGSGGTSLSDSARQEAYRRLSTAQTLPQLQATLGVIKKEMANRTASLTEQEGALVGQLKHGLVAPGQTDPTGLQGAPGAPAAPQVVKDRTGRSVPAQMFEAMKQFYGSKAPKGSEGNPLTILHDQDFALVPRGAYFMGPDGHVRGPKP